MTMRSKGVGVYLHELQRESYEGRQLITYVHLVSRGDKSMGDNTVYFVMGWVISDIRLNGCYLEYEQEEII